MTECAGRPDLASECETFTRYLIGRSAPPYVVGRYVAAHRARAQELSLPPSGDERFFVEIARRGPRWSWLVDCYVRPRAAESLFRRKLVLLVALLECWPATAGRFYSESRESAARVVGRLLARGASFLLGVLVSSLVLPPLRIFRGTSRAESTAGGDAMREVGSGGESDA